MYILCILMKLYTLSMIRFRKTKIIDAAIVYSRSYILKQNCKGKQEFVN